MQAVSDEALIRRLGARRLGVEQREHRGGVQPVGRFLLTQGGSMATPGPGVCVGNHTGANRIQHDIPTEFLKIALLFHEHALEPALQQVAHALMPPIKPLCVRAMESLQATAEIRFGRFKHEMKVIVHEAVDETMPMLLPDFSPKQPTKLLPIPVIEKDGLSRIAAGRDVIKGAGEFQAEGAGHEAGG